MRKYSNQNNFSGASDAFKDLQPKPMAQTTPSALSKTTDSQLNNEANPKNRQPVRLMMLIINLNAHSASEENDLSSSPSARPRPRSDISGRMRGF